MAQSSPSHGQSWLAARGWQPFEFQREVWQAIAQGASGMLHATTGSGKTYAVWLGMLGELLLRHPPARRAEPLRVLWLTPMRALASDTTRALAQPLRDLAPQWTIGQRTGDTSSAERAPPGPALSHRAGHNARVAEPDAHARARA
jgi:ATP-dependent helicase Lhr and Lhr-like helicase